MKDKKRFILSFILLVCFFSIGLNEMFMQIKYYKTEQNLIKDNYIAIAFNDDYNSIGWTQNQISQIESIDHIKDINYFNTKALNSEQINYSIDKSFADNKYRYDFYMTSNNWLPMLDETKLEFIAGHNLTKENGIIIDENIANEIVSKSDEFETVDDLINQTMSGIYEYEIEGVYKNSYSKLSPKFIYYDTFSEFLGISITDNSSFINYDQSNVESCFWCKKQVAISDYNFSYAYANGYENKIVTKDVEFSDAAGKTNANLLDYEATKANGVDGLIDPQSDEYGDYMYNLAYIEVDDVSNVDFVIDELTKLNVYEKMVTKDTKLSEINPTINVVLSIVLISFLLSIIMFHKKYLINNSKEELIAYIIAVAIASIVALFISVQVTFAVISISIIGYGIIYVTNIIQKRR